MDKFLADVEFVSNSYKGGCHIYLQCVRQLPICSRSRPQAQDHNIGQNDIEMMDLNPNVCDITDKKLDTKSDHIPNLEVIIIQPDSTIGNLLAPIIIDKDSHIDRVPIENEKKVVEPIVALTINDHVSEYEESLDLANEMDIQGLDEMNILHCDNLLEIPKQKNLDFELATIEMFLENDLYGFDSSWSKKL